MATYDLCLMPQDMLFMPTSQAINNARRSLSRYFEWNEGIKVRKESTPFFVSAWYDCEQYICPCCGKTVTYSFAEENNIDWFGFLTEAAKASDARTHQVKLPCCGAEAPLTELNFVSEQGHKRSGIACLQISVKDIESGLTTRQFEQLEKTLGCKLNCFIEIGG